MPDFPSDQPLPALRPLRHSGAEHDGRHYVVFQDELGLAEPQAAPLYLAYVLELCDGRRTAAEICAEHLRFSGFELAVGHLHQMVASAQERLLCDGPAFRAALAAALADYRALPCRPMVLADAVYPSDPTACAQRLDSLLEEGQAGQQPIEGTVVGIMAPHIDFGRGGAAYGAAFGALRGGPADLCILLGTAHRTSLPDEPAAAPAIATRVSYDTPFGPLPIAQDFLDDVLSRYQAAGGDAEQLLADELVHRDEHSLEFASLWVKHVLADREVKAVPLLMGSPHRHYDCPQTLADQTGLGPLLTALRGAIKAYPGRVCVVAAADWSHVGPGFGAEHAVTEADLPAIAAADERALRPWLAGDPDGFFAALAADGNAQHVCSAAGLYVLRALLPQATARLLRYDQAFDPEQTVTFASAVLTEP